MDVLAASARRTPRRWVWLRALLGALVAPVRGQPIPFAHVILDADHSGGCKEVGDLDGDGFPDVVLGGSDGLWWYRYPAWTRTLIATPVEQFSTDVWLADVDRDGDLDVVVPDGSTGRLAWYENPRPAGNPGTPGWIAHPIGNTPAFIHDVRTADLNADGRIDVVTCHHSGYDAWIQSPAGPDGPWTHIAISARAGTGLSVGDIDSDGLPDVVLGPVWLKTPADPVSGVWTERPIGAGWPVETSSLVADINGDGRPDVVIAPSESSGRMSWYEAPASPLSGPWTEHIVTDSIGYVHAFFVADMNRDGVPDIIFAEMAQSAQRRVGYFLGSAGGATWTLNVVATTGSHNIRVADIGRDGDLDIIGANWQGPPLEAWINGSNPARCAGDWDRDGALLPADVATYVVGWLTSLPSGALGCDLDGNGRVEPADVSLFIITWFNELVGGC